MLLSYQDCLTQHLYMLQSLHGSCPINISLKYMCCAPLNPELSISTIAYVSLAKFDNPDVIDILHSSVRKELGNKYRQLTSRS